MGDFNIDIVILNSDYDKLEQWKETCITKTHKQLLI